MSSPQSFGKGLRGHFDLHAWADHHDLIPEFLDFQHETYSPVDALQAIGDILEDTPKTGQLIRVRDFTDRVPDGTSGEYIGNNAGHRLNVLMNVYGAWEAPNQSPSWTTRAFINPNYIHLDHLNNDFLITNETDRRDYLEQVLQHGLIDTTDIAATFGITTSTLRTYFADIYPDTTFRTHRQDGLRRTARTWKTLYDWGFGYKELAGAFNVNHNTLRSTISRLVDDDFTPPQDPSTPSFDHRPWQYAHTRKEQAD